MSDKIAPPSHNINSFQKNLYSQCGEDGIVEELLNRIYGSSQHGGWCVEFGALDGVYLSNTYNLIKNKSYRAVLIEGDKRRYKLLCRNLPQQEVIKLCCFVSFEGQSALDCILQKTPIPLNFDFLSIDIDGCDYHIFESLKLYRPKIVCIEFNPTVPNEVQFVQPRDFNIKQGCGARSIVELAVKKGYSLVAATHCNLIFVLDDLKELVVGSANLSLEALRDDSHAKTFIFFGYDGTVLMNKDEILIPWHRIKLNPNHMQQLPRFLRRFGGDYSLLQQLGFAIFVLFKFPRSFPEIFHDKFLRKFRKQS